MATATVIAEGNRQTVLLPPEVHLDVGQVFVKQVGDSVMLVPKRTDPWQLFEEALGQASDDFMEERIQPPQDTREIDFE